MHHLVTPYIMSFEAIIFDCDGVLVDSEPVTLSLLRGLLAQLGWDLGAEECANLFIGKSTDSSLKIIQAHIGKKPEQDWIDEFQLRRAQAIHQKTVATPGIHYCLEQVQNSWPQKIACASAAGLQRIRLQLTLVGLNHYFDDQIYSGVDVSYNKPYPDVYLAAATGLAANPKHCAIIEDSITGVLAGVGAGGTVFAYDTKHNPEPLLQAGASLVFSDMKELPYLLTNYHHS